MKILVLLGSARVNREGQKVADWVMRSLASTPGVEAELVDLKALELPFYDEPLNPADIKNRDYENPKGRAWAEKVGSAEAFIFLCAEYNHSYTALLKNSIDWIYNEWVNKPVAYISYSNGAISGARGVEHIKTVCIHVGLHPLPASIHIPSIQNFFDESGEPKSDYFTPQVGKMAANLVKISEALRGLRAPSA